jgi:hypothetical protein
MIILRQANQRGAEQTVSMCSSKWSMNTVAKSLDNLGPTS